MEVSVNYQYDTTHSSDIDLTLKSPRHNTLALVETGAALDQINLPHSIDLSIYEKITNPDLIAPINNVGIVFLEKKA